MSILGHVAVGVAAARLASAGDRTPSRAPAMAFLAALALLPDVDFLLTVAAPDVPALEHRAATHSFAAAALAGLAAGLVCRVMSVRRPAVWGAVAGLVIASHGILDALGDTTLGVELLWPFSSARILAPWHVLPNPSPSPVWPFGLGVLAVEALWFLPMWLYAFAPRSWWRKRQGVGPVERRAGR